MGPAALPRSPGPLRMWRRYDLLAARPWPGRTGLSPCHRREDVAVYELNRARLVGIGPRGARYTDVTLDLSSVGIPLPRQTLFDDPARRPSPYTLLMLENGGGKSVLLSLLFSVVLPGRKKTVGGAAMENYVQATDTGHVVLEWIHVQSGQRFITGKVFQRRATTPGNSNPLTEAWYSFRPSDTLHVGSLPVADDSRRRRVDGYRDALEQAGRAHPATELVWVGDDQTRWKTHLRDSGIEPDLFDIQRSMNADEGDAADAFKFSSSKAFVDWLLRTVTDPADAASVAETFEQWAITLAERTKMLLEKDFLEGAVAGLDPLAGAWQQHQLDERARGQAETRAGRLHAAITARHAHETTRAGALETEAGTARTRVADADRLTREARDTRNEIQLATTRLETEEVEARQENVAGRLELIEAEIAGWNTVSAIHAADEATATAKALAEQVDAADQGAAGDRRRRDEAAGRFLAKLDAEVSRCEEQETGLVDAAQAERSAAETAGEEQSRAQRDAGTASAHIEAAEKTVDTAEADLASALVAALVPEHTLITDIPRLLDSAARDHQQAKDALEAAEGRAGQLQTRLRADEGALRTSQAQLATLARTAENAEQASQEADTAATRVAELPAIIAHAGDRIGAPDGNSSTTEATSPAAADHPEADAATGGVLAPEELDAAADTLLTILVADMNAHTEQMDGLRQEQRADSRVLDALGDGGLLPPRPDVELAVHVLVADGIAAHSGWRYLQDTAAVGTREDLIARHPALADGVVLVDSGQLDQARDVLTKARLLPAAAITVGTGAELLATDQANSHAERSGDTGLGAARAWFVVPPSPSMYDEDAAEQTRTELLTQMEARTLRIGDLDEQLAKARDGHTRLSAWRHDFPAGRLAQLRAAAHDARQISDQQQEDVDTAAERCEQTKTSSEQADVHVQGCALAERAAGDRVMKLSHLADRLRDAAGAARDLPGLRQELRSANQQARDAKTRAQQHLKQVEELIKQAANVHAIAGRLRSECDEVPSTDATRSDVVPDEPLSELRAAVKATHDAYLAAAPGDTLRASAAQASERASERRKEVSAKDPQAVAEGRRLLATPAGADRAGWAAARENAARNRQQQNALRDALTKEMGRLVQLISQQQPESGTRWIVLSADRVPASAEHGRALEREAAEQLAAAQVLLDDARADIERVAALQADAQTAAAGFAAAAVPLKTLLRAQAAHDQTAQDVDPYPGTAGDAASAADAAAVDISDSREAVARAKTVLDDATDELIQFTHQARYDDMPNVVRRSILGADRAQLGARAREWADALRARHASLMTDLESATRHRTSIVGRLSALATQALGTLHQASKLSRLPDDLGDWGRRPFLRIAFSEPDAAATSVRVASVVDDLASAYAGRTTTGRGSRTRRDGMSLLLEAVHAAVPKGFHVDILKPDSVLRDERVAVENMKKVFSGGQELTAAIVLYCTLAALKANQRGQMRARHSGVLFLDNPIGKASATYLLDVQQAVAQSLGVQLIYTTGLFDDRVLASFPLWIRLRNDADLRAGLKHLRVAEVVTRQLPDPYDDNELGTSGSSDAAPATVTSTRVYRRPSAGGSSQEVPA
jgi:hypothetical protein